MKFQDASLLFEKSIKNRIDIEDLDKIISWPNDQLSILFACADQVRHHYFGNKVKPCSLMNIKSGGCSEDCAFCAQSAHNKTNIVVRELAKPDEIRKQALEAQAHNLPFCVVSSGRKLSTQEIQMVADVIRDCTVEKHASLGILDENEFGILHDAGVVCYNHNLETSRSFYSSIVSTHSYDDRIATVKAAKKAGIKVCCGGIFGLGETWEHRKEFLLELRNLDVDTVPVNFIIPIPGTRISAPEESALDFLRIVSMFRLAMPSKTIKICGGREVHLGQLQSLMFWAGANGYVSGGYLTTPGAGISADDSLINMLGLEKQSF
jgi:biotin synthase